MGNESKWRNFGGRQRRALTNYFLTRLLAVIIDVFTLAVAYAVAFMLRFEFKVPSWGLKTVALSFVTVLFVHLAALLFTGIYRLSWRRLSATDVPRYVSAMALAALLMTFLRYLLPVETFSHIRPPYSITLMTFILGTMGILATRYLWRRFCMRHHNVSEFIEREERHFDCKLVAQFLSGRTVLVTGAGGTIGAEIVRQAVSAGAAKVLMLERSEHALYEIDYELNGGTEGKVAVPLLRDVLDVQRVKQIFVDYSPEVVLHAAAYKHVPMVERNPEEGYRNNVQATRQLAEIAKTYGVSRFVLISTDKAVNPVSEMGRNKREAELAVMALADERFSACAVRFGNVFGSSGSVVPLFKRLIAEHKPLPVTHPDMRRYFMTVSEAVQLVLQAASRKERAIYTLDMGESVRIVDLAEKLICQAGLRPYVDIPIVFTGKRPGEKLFEELDISEKSAYRTDMAKIYITKA